MGSSPIWTARDVGGRSRELGVDDIRGILAAAEPRGLPFDADRDDLSSVGWGVIVDRGVSEEIRGALAPLLDLRRSQAGGLFQELTYAGEEPNLFLRRYGGGRARGPVDLERLPYYLLLVGDPEPMSFDLQFALDSQRAVGRVHFEDAGQVARWVATVCDGETAQFEPEMSVFAPTHDDDPLTASSLADLASPLADAFALKTGWAAHRSMGSEATKSRLGHHFERPSSLFFSAGHAMRYASGHRRQAGYQGSLVCADWPGPKRWRGPLIDEFLFTSDDLPAGAVSGPRLAFCFACYTLGTPKHDLFTRPSQKPSKVADRAFVSRLSQSMLSDGGFGAVVGYVDQVYESAFRREDDGERVTTFVDALSAAALGHRPGGALECFAERYAELATDIAETVWTTPEDEMSDEQLRGLDDLWHAFQDARSFGLLGDPAFQLGGSRPQ